MYNYNYGYGYGVPQAGPTVDVNGDGIPDYQIRTRYVPVVSTGVVMAPRAVGVDVNGDGIPDYKVRPGFGIDVNGDGIADYRASPTVAPGPGLYTGVGYRPYGY